MKNNLPDNWQLVKLGEVCETTSGGTPSRKNPSYYNGNIPWVKSGELTHDIIYDTEEKISANALKNSSAKIFPKGTLLIALYGATVGKLGFLGIEAATNQAVCAIFENKKIDLKFLYYFLFFKRPFLVEQSFGGAQPNISQTILKELELPFPSHPEQQQIVSTLESIFTDLDAGIAQIKKAQQQIKIYRQAVLKWAFEGRFTNKNVNGELPKGWKWFSIKDVCNKIQDGSHFSPQKQYNSRVANLYPYITAKNIRTNYMDLSNVTYIEKEFHDSIFSRCNPEFGDVLLTKDGVNTGDVTLNELHEPFSLLSSVCLIKTKNEKLIPAFLKYYIQSPIGEKMILGKMTGTAIKRIILKQIKEAQIIVPPLKEQERVVKEIEIRFSIAYKLEKTIEQNLRQTVALRQSILKSAFEGKIA